MQTAFAKAYRSWRRISRLESPEAYVRRMAVNEVLNTRRTAHVRHEMVRAELPGRTRRRRATTARWPTTRCGGRSCPCRRGSAPCWCCATTRTSASSRSPTCLGCRPGHGEVAGIGRAGDSPDAARPADGEQERDCDEPRGHAASRPSTSAARRGSTCRPVTSTARATHRSADAGTPPRRRRRCRCSRWWRPESPGTLVVDRDRARGRPDGAGRPLARAARRRRCSPRADAVSVLDRPRGDRARVATPTRARPAPTAASRRRPGCATARRTTRATNTWRPIPPAPVRGRCRGPAGRGATGVVVLRATRGRRRLPLVHLRAGPQPLVPHRPTCRRRRRRPALGDRATGVRDRRAGGSRCTTSTRFTWSLLPPDRIRPALTQRSVTATAERTRRDGVRRDAAERRPRRRRWCSPTSGTARRGSGCRRATSWQTAFSWTGHRMVDPSPFTENGGEVDSWGARHPPGRHPRPGHG